MKMLAPLLLSMVLATTVGGVRVPVVPPQDAAASAAPQTTPPMHIQPNGQPKIKHFVVLIMENRAVDHIFGCMAGEGVIKMEGINGSHSIPVDPDDASKGTVNVTCGTANYVCKHGPPYSTFLLKVKQGTNASFYPYGPQDDKYSYANGGRDNAILMFNSTQLPIKTTIAKEFAVFNHLHSSVPSFSTPNHLFWGSGTSCGLSTNPVAHQGCNSSSYEPPTHIFDSLHAANVSYKSYSNSSSGACSSELGLEATQRHKDRCFSMGEFYKDAAAGTLPAFSFMSPPGEACDHPCHDIAKGERLMKDLYEALRAGPGWENTLFFVAYDDGGGTYDHVVPPSEGVPNPGTDDVCMQSKCSGHPFDFRRLGIRVTSFLISPWIPANTAIQHPSGPTPSSRYDLTSGLATAKELFDLPSFLTKRDAWSGSFGPLLTLDKPRTDCPMHFPAGPPISGPWTCPGCHNEASELRRLREVEEQEKQAQHCSAQKQVCQGTASITERQKRQIRSLSQHFPESTPALETLDYQTAERWIDTHEHKWMNEVPVLSKLDREEFMRRTAPARR